MRNGVTPLPFGDMFSADPCAATNSAHRVDPYYDDLWVHGSQLSWISRELGELRQSVSSARMYYDDRRFNNGDARDRLLARHKFRQRRLSTLAAVGMWRTPSDQQIAAIVGAPQVAHRATDLLLGFSAGLLEHSAFPSPNLSTPNRNLPFLYRPIEGPVFKQFSKRLTYNQWIAVTAGYPWERGNQYDRHNMLATEFGLRVAEFCGIACVVGESLSSFKLIAPTHAVPLRSTAAADLVVVRTDGLKIAVEITANTGSNFDAKVNRWVNLLANIDPAEDGLTVLFLDASKRGSLTPVITRAIEKLVFNKVGARRLRVPERIAVAGWRDWFPSANCGTHNFYELTCQRPTGLPGDLWQPARLLDCNDVTYEPTDPAGARAVLTYQHNLWGVPHWLRDEDQGVDHLALLMRRMGVTDPTRGRATPRNGVSG